MNVRVAISLFLITWVYDLNTNAEDQTAKLPDDGWWIRYSWNEKTEVNGVFRGEYTEKMTCSLVGTRTEDGEKCRWVELNRVWSLENKERISLYKILIPEKDLLESEKPLGGLKRGWFKNGDFDVRAIKLGQEIKSNSNLLRFFPGRWQKTERLDKARNVDYQKGRLSISEARTRTDKTAITTRAQIEESTAWFDPITAPVFSFACFRIKNDENDDKLNFSKEIEMVIEDIGNEAQSKMPDNN